MKDKQLRFALLARVSTDEQGKKGHSIDEQIRQNKQAIEALGGKLVREYTGQQHATKGSDTYLFDQILADAQTNKWDCLIVAFADRFSRDNVQASTGLDLLRKQNKRFFVGTKEYDLWSTDDRFFLSMSYIMGQKITEDYAQRSRRNRLDAAMQVNSQGYNHCASTPPYGRLWDKEKKLWSVEVDKKRIVEKAAEIYLGNGDLRQYAKHDAGMSYQAMLRILRHKAGGTMTVTFKRTEINPQAETLELKIPRLLPDSTIKEIEKKATERRWSAAGQPPKHQYLLTRHVFCGHCQRALSGQSYNVPKGSSNWYIFYRHPKTDCTPYHSVRALELEQLVYESVFKLVGNQRELLKATKRATPTIEQQKELSNKIAKAEAGHKQVQRQIGTIVKKISQELLSDEEAAGTLAELRDRKRYFETQIDELKMEIKPLPTEQQIERSAQLLSAVFKHALMSDDEDVARHANKVQHTKRRELLDLIFSGKDHRGKKYGCYVTKEDADTLRVQIYGHYFTPSGNHINVDTYKNFNIYNYNDYNSYMPNSLSFEYDLVMGEPLKIAA